MMGSLFGKPSTPEMPPVPTAGDDPDEEALQWGGLQRSGAMTRGATMLTREPLPRISPVREATILGSEAAVA